jgi:hypothetical protein
MTLIVFIIARSLSRKGAAALGIREGYRYHIDVFRAAKYGT